MNEVLTVTFTRSSDGWNVTFKIEKNAEMVYCLDAGKYTYTIDAPPPWADVNGEFELAAGDYMGWPIWGRQ